MLSAHALQYQNDPRPEFRGYRDTDYPSDYGHLYAGDVDTSWHHLSVTVRGDYYMFLVDGRMVVSGYLSSWKAFPGSGAAGQGCGGVFICVWSGATVEVRRLRVTPD